MLRGTVITHLVNLSQPSHSVAMSSQSNEHVHNNHGDKLERPLSHEEFKNALHNTMTLSPEAFEKLYLGPKTAVTGDLRTTFANPTPIALLGFSVGLFPLSIAFSE